MRKESSGIRQGDRRDGKDSRQLAEEWLLDRTEPLRMRHREDALALVARQIQTEEERLKDRIDQAKRKMTVGEFADAFRDSPRRPDCGEDMADFYCGVVRRFAEAVGKGETVASVTDGVANAYAKSIAAHMAAGTFNKAMNALTLVWKVAGPEAGVRDNPWAGIARRKSDAHIRRPFTREETDAILAAAKGEMRTLVAVCLYTGLRLGDACRLKWEDIRGDAVYVITAKRDRKVAIPLHPKLAKALGRRKKEGYVMPETATRYAEARQGPSNVSRSVKRLIERCGIASSVEVEKGGRLRPDATAHSLRHTFVTRAIEAGVAPHAVQAIVGHADLAMTERYTHLSDEAVLSAFRRMK